MAKSASRPQIPRVDLRRTLQQTGLTQWSRGRELRSTAQTGLSSRFVDQRYHPVDGVIRVDNVRPPGSGEDDPGPVPLLKDAGLAQPGITDGVAETLREQLSEVVAARAA